MGSIPAHTGERRDCSRSDPQIRVYPRTYGGTAGERDGVLSRMGLSPHIRGNVTAQHNAFSTCGSIPAHTGERQFCNQLLKCVGVYPRTYGGTSELIKCAISVVGLSPHIRGNGFDHDEHGITGGSIPAHTGERAGPWRLRSHIWVYPRTYGGTLPPCHRSMGRGGLSPHIRGNGGCTGHGSTGLGSIPAHTGE